MATSTPWTEARGGGGEGEATYVEAEHARKRVAVDTSMVSGDGEDLGGGGLGADGRSLQPRKRRVEPPFSPATVVVTSGNRIEVRGRKRGADRDDSGNDSDVDGNDYDADLADMDDDDPGEQRERLRGGGGVGSVAAEMERVVVE